MTRSGGAGRAKPPAARAKPPKTKAKTNEGRWTDEEHRKFLEAYDSMIAVDPARRRWPTVAAAVGTRSTTQCRSHTLCGNQNFCGAFVLNRRVDLHVIDATPAR